MEFLGLNLAELGLATLGMTVAGLAINWAFKQFLPRKKTRLLGYKNGLKLREKLKNFDIPIISGDAETDLKKNITMTSADYSLGFACGAFGWDPEDVVKKMSGK